MMKETLNSLLVAAAEPVGDLVDVLKSEAGLYEKSEACRKLARIGDASAVPALAELLADDKLSHMARYGLETIPDPSADEALRAALDKLEGHQLVGVIGSIGVRKDKKATSALGKQLKSENLEAVQAAAKALGRIGTEIAMEALRDHFEAAPKGTHLDFIEGAFRCADALAADGDKEIAVTICDFLRRDAFPTQVRTAALRGSILHRESEGTKLLVESLSNKDLNQAKAALRTSAELEGTEVTAALAGEVPKLSGEIQVILIQTLGNRKDPAALPALIEASKSGDREARLAAIRALPEIGDEVAVVELDQLVEDPDDAIAEAAEKSLAAFTKV